MESGEESERVTGYEADEDSIPVSPSAAFQLLTEADTYPAPNDNAEMSDGNEAYDPLEALQALGDADSYEPTIDLSHSADDA